MSLSDMRPGNGGTNNFLKPDMHFKDLVHVAGDTPNKRTHATSGNKLSHVVEL